MATFTNQATLSYQGGQTSSNITTGQLLESLAVTKTAVNGTYVPGGTVTYAVSLRNTGTVDLSGVTLTDDLGAYAFGAQALTPLRARCSSTRTAWSSRLPPSRRVRPSASRGSPSPPGGASCSSTGRRSRSSLLRTPRARW